MAWQLHYIICLIPFLQSINQVLDLVSNSSGFESDVWEVSWNDQEMSLFWALFIIRSLQKNVLCAFGQEKPLIYTWCFVYIVHTLSLCARPVHLKRPQFACSGLLNWRLWEAVVLPQGRPCSTLVRVRYATAITVEAGENVAGWCLKVLSGLCFERRRMIVRMMAGYIPSQKYLTSVFWTGPVWILHKGVIILFYFFTVGENLKLSCWCLTYCAF